MRKYGVGGWEEICETGSKKFCVLGKNGKTANVMTVWIQDKDTEVVRLISIYVTR